MLNLTLDFIGPPVINLLSNTGSGSKQQLVSVQTLGATNQTYSWAAGGAGISIYWNGSAYVISTTSTDIITGTLRVSASNRGGYTELLVPVSVSNLDAPAISVTGNSGTGTTTQVVTASVTNGGTISAAWVSGGSGISVSQSGNQFTFSASSGSPSGTIRLTASNRVGSSSVDVAISLVATPPATVGTSTGSTDIYGIGVAKGTFTVSSGSTLSAARISANMGLTVTQVNATTFSWTFKIGNGSAYYIETWRITASNGSSSSYIDVKVTVEDASAGNG